MRVVSIKNVGKNFTYQWPDGQETFDFFIEYEATASDGKHDVRIGYCKREAYGKNRIRAVVWIDEHPHAEFLGADDFENSGEILSEIKIPGDIGERILRYPEEPIPERYAMFNFVGLPLRVQGPGVHKAWAVVANIADHKTLIDLAALRKLERER
ncbi:MAG: hypothetical protein NO515_01665 [Candidatus Methanomethylicia archaeon]|jgi:hypothetical protein|nr:hypothetical protein [Candidatus Methanomethylicia archaeon]